MKMKGQYCSTVSSFSILLAPPLKVSATSSSSPKSKSSSSSSSLKRRTISLSAISTALSVLIIPNSKSSCWSKPEFLELQNSAGVKALDFRIGDGDLPFDGDQVAIHYYGRLAAKQGWRFDSTYDHKDETGESIPFVFILGSGKVISGIEAAVRSMKVGGIRRVIIPPSQGYQNTSQEPIPPNFFDRQRLFTTIFNPTRLANGEGSTLGTLIFDIELVNLRHRRKLSLLCKRFLMSTIKLRSDSFLVPLATSPTNISLPSFGVYSSFLLSKLVYSY